jgi:hypothetical protein
VKELLDDYEVPIYFKASPDRFFFDSKTISSKEDYFEYVGDERPPYRWIVIGPEVILSLFLKINMFCNREVDHHFTWILIALLHGMQFYLEGRDGHCIHTHPYLLESILTTMKMATLTVTAPFLFSGIWKLIHSFLLTRSLLNASWNQVFFLKNGSHCKLRHL